MKKTEKYIYIVLGIILIVVIACSITYVIATNNNDAKTKEENNNQEENNNEDSITLSEAELNEYLSYVPKSALLSNYEAYETPNNINALSEEIVIDNALRVLTMNDDFENMEDYYTIEEFPEYSFDIRYSLEEVRNQTLKMYNYNITNLTNVTSENIGEGMYSSEAFIFDYYNNYFYGMML